MKTLLATIIIGITTLVTAQDIDFGFKAGANFANLIISGTGTEDFKQKRQTSFHAGGMVEFQLSDFIAVQPELLLSMQGTATTVDEITATKFQSKLTYITLPIMAKFFVAEELSLSVGPQVSYLVAAKLDYNATLPTVGEEAPINFSKSFDAKPIYNAIDYGINFGLSYMIENGLNFGVRYNLGFANISNGKTINPLTGDTLPVNTALYNPTVKNSVLQVSIGYFFNQL